MSGNDEDGDGEEDMASQDAINDESENNWFKVKRQLCKIAWKTNLKANVEKEIDLVIVRKTTCTLSPSAARLLILTLHGVRSVSTAVLYAP